VDKVGESVDNTKQKVGGAADSFGDFQAEISGAMSAVVAGLAIAAAGLASQVPVIGGVLEGLGAIVDAVAFQIDGVLRPALTPITDKLFEWSNAIYESDGALGDIIGIIGSAIIIIGTLAAGVLAAAKAWGLLTAAFAIIKGVALTVAGAIGGVVSTIGAIPIILGVAIAALLGFIAAYLTNWKGTRDKTNKIIGKIVTFIVNGFNTFTTKARKVLDKWVGKVVTFFKGLWSDIKSGISNFISNAVGWGKDFAQSFILGMSVLAQGLVDLITNALNDVVGVINTVIDNLPDAITSRIGISGGIDEVEAPSVGPDKGAIRDPAINPMFPGGRTRTISMDGRKLTENTGRYDRDRTARRGVR